MVRETVIRGDVTMERVPSTNNIADLLTKPLTQKGFEHHYRTIGLMHMGD